MCVLKWRLKIEAGVNVTIRQPVGTSVSKQVGGDEGFLYFCLPSLDSAE